MLTHSHHSTSRFSSIYWIAAVLILTLLGQATTSAFSPYEEYLRSGKETHVALIAKIQPDKLDDFKKAFKQCEQAAIAKNLSQAGISSLQSFTREIKSSQVAVIRFTYAGKLPYLGAAKAFETATSTIDWKASITPHPRAVSYGRNWLQMEWICFIRGLDVDREPASTFLLTTNVIPEKEQEYRTLHQTVWPGVVDQITRGNLRNLNVHLVELDGDLVEFLYADYMGNDSAKHDKANQADPINQRWWKLTDACQKPFADVKKGIWAPMEIVK